MTRTIVYAVGVVLVSFFALLALGLCAAASRGDRP